uniref:Uncharacterized protein n=1 Tax=Oryza sativa subsp. japonica TaxID=39947 RepID=Q5VRQ6_ORYSJ|nr:hypothetical protein [Oryza sativa Japonica Group]BAD67871.1 hypothetical protein [Oryza sativa Japonica Group]
MAMEASDVCRERDVTTREEGVRWITDSGRKSSLGGGGREVGVREDGSIATDLSLSPSSRMSPAVSLFLEFKEERETREREKGRCARRRLAAGLPPPPPASSPPTGCACPTEEKSERKEDERGREVERGGEEEADMWDPR